MPNDDLSEIYIDLFRYFYDETQLHKFKTFYSLLSTYIGCSLKCIIIIKVGVEESIVNAPLVSLQSKNTNNATSEVRFKQLIRDL
jgi:hypothetical protein